MRVTSPNEAESLNRCSSRTSNKKKKQKTKGCRYICNFIYIYIYNVKTSEKDRAKIEEQNKIDTIAIVKAEQEVTVGDMEQL